MGFIDKAEFAASIERLPSGEYREYMRLVCEEGLPSVQPVAEK